MDHLVPSPKKAKLLKGKRMRTSSIDWVSSPRASPRNNLEAASDTTDVDRHLQNMSALLHDMPPLVSPATMEEQLEFHIGSLEEMRANINVLVRSFMGNDEVIQRLLEMHDRLDRCIGLHRSIQPSPVPKSSLRSSSPAIVLEATRKQEKKSHTKSIRGRKMRAREALARTSSSPSRLTPPRPESPSHVQSGGSGRSKTNASKERVRKTKTSRSSPNSKSRPKRRKREASPTKAVNSHSAPTPSTQNSLAVDLPLGRPVSRTPTPTKRIFAEPHLPQRTKSSTPVASTHSTPTRSKSAFPSFRTSPPPPPPTPAPGFAAHDGAVVRKALSPQHDHSTLLAEVSRRLSSGTDTTDESDDERLTMEKIRARLMEVAAASSRTSQPSVPSSAPRPSSGTSPSSKTVRTKSDSAFMSNVEVRARLEDLLNSLKSPTTSPTTSPRLLAPSAQHLPVVKVRRHRRKRRTTPSGLEVNCPICWEGTPLDACVRLAACGHMYCSSCLGTYCSTKINEGQVLAFACPEPKCTREITPNELIQLVDDQTFRRYQQFHMLATLNINPNCRWCPRPGCNTGIIADPSQPVVVCQTCQMEFCFQCKEPWHEGLECGATPTEPDESLSAYMEACDAKKCPSCESVIERNKGCNMMKCRVCSHQFCWLCLEPYTLEHYDEGPCKGKWGVSKTEMALVYTLAGGMIVASAAVAIPTVVIGAPIYGSYRIGKWVKKGRKKSKRKQ